MEHHKPRLVLGADELPYRLKQELGVIEVQGTVGLVQQKDRWSNFRKASSMVAPLLKS